MEDMEFVKIGVREMNQLGGTVYKDAIITIPESTLRRIVWMYKS